MEILQWIENVVANNLFPILAFWLIFNENKEIRKKHAEETERLSDVIANNTLAIQRLIDKCDK